MDKFGIDIQEISSGIYEINKVLITSEEIKKAIDSLQQNFKEIHVLCDALHIDTNINVSGKNFAIRANSIEIHDKVEWNFSGKDKISYWPEEAGEDLNGRGLDGKNGEHGENGGNVSIDFITIINPSLWIIKSNGGNGSRGQNGGFGRKGADGQNAEKSDFAIGDKEITYSGFSFNHLDYDQSKVSEIIQDGTFTKMVYETNNNLTGEVYANKNLVLVLVRGSKPEEGKKGGLGGYGGEPGYAGKIEIRSECTNGTRVEKEANNGHPGENGDDRNYSIRGTEGRDMFKFQNRSKSNYNGENKRLKYKTKREPYYLLPKVFTFGRNMIKDRKIHWPKQKCYIKIVVDKEIQNPTNISYNTVRNDAVSRMQNKQNSEINMDLIRLRHESFLASTFNITETFQTSTMRHVDYDVKNIEQRRIMNKNKNSSALSISKDSKNNEFENSVLEDEYKKLKQMLKNVFETKPMDDNDELIKGIVGFFEEVYQKYSLNTLKLNEQKKISFITSEFSEKFRFLSKSLDPEINSDSEELIKHFNENSDFENNEILIYFQENVRNFNSSLPESIFNYFMSLNNLDDSLSKIIDEFSKKINNFDNTYDNAKLDENLKINTESEAELKSILSEFFAKEEMINFIKNEINKSGIMSPVYRKTLAHKYSYRLVICIRNLNNMLELYEWHNYGDDLRFSYAENEVYTGKYDETLTSKSPKKAKIIESSPTNNNAKEKEELFIIMENGKFSLMKFDEFRYNCFENQEQYNKKFNEIIFILENFGQRKNFNFLDINNLLFLENSLQKNQVDQQKIINIFHENKLNENELFETLISYFPKTFYKIQDDDIEMHVVDYKDLEMYKNIVNYYQVDEKLEKSKIKWLLEIIAKIGGISILTAITIRIVYDKSLPTIEPFTILLKSIFKLLSQNEGFKTSLTFLILGNKQEMWIPEIIMIEFQNIFGKLSKEQYDKWKNLLKENENENLIATFLNKIIQLEENDSLKSLNVSIVDEIIDNLKYIDDNCIQHFQHMNLLTWGAITTEKYWNEKLNGIVKLQSFENTDELKTLFEDLHNKYGTKVRKLVEILLEKNQDVANIDLKEILMNFTKGKWIFSEKVVMALKNISMENWIGFLNAEFKASEDVINAAKIIELIEKCDETSLEIKEKTPKITKQLNEVRELIDNSAQMSEKELLENTADAIKQELRLLAIIIRVIYLKTNIMLRDTQIISILVMINSNDGVLMQVSTGEGKTLIAIAFSILKTLQDEKVDIITSSNVLAIRDATKKEHIDIFNFFKINVNHNCYERSSIRKEMYAGQIVYGTLSSFQRDYLLTEFYEQKIMPNHHFKNIVIDEVDSMLLDKGNNILYLSQDLPDLDEIESVLIFIWQLVNQNFSNSVEEAEFTKISLIRKIVLDNMYGILDESDIRMMQPNVDAENVMKILKDHEIIIEEDLINKEKFNEEKISGLLKSFGDELSEKIIVFCREKIKQERHIKLPNHLKDFMLQHLNQWIENAFRALFLEVNKEYIIDIPKTGKIDEYPNVNIIDLDTGTEMTNSQWNECLHQFLQLKHGCKLSTLSLKSVFISNVSFFKKYKKMYGMTGTLGSLQEREKVTKIHDIKFVTIPRYVFRKFDEYQPIINTNKSYWLNAIYDEVKSIIIKNRSVLIICKTIQDTERMRQKIITMKEDETVMLKEEDIILYQRDSDKFNIHELKNRNVIISTNLAGRGTDIRLASELVKSGGLHVILTNISNNSRIEEQAFGRAARSGEPGSGRLIIIAPENTTMSKLKEARNQHELNRLDEISTYYENFIKIEENFFENFRSTYSKLKGKQNHEIYLMNFVVQWSFWLDKNSKLLDEWKNNKNYSVLQQNFDKFLEQKANLHPIMRIKLYNNYISKDKYSDADKLMNDDKFHEDLFVHQYSKLYGILKRNQKENGYKNRTLTDCEHKQVRKCLNMLRSTICNRYLNIQFVNHIRMKTQENSIPFKGFAEQQMAIIECFEEISRSLTMLLGESINPESLETNIIVSDVIKNELYDELISKNCINPPRISKFYTTEDIENISKKHKIKFTDLKKFLEQHQNDPILSIRQLQDRINDSFKLPSRNAFWKMLIEHEILYEEEEYGIIDSNILKEIDPSASEIIDKDISIVMLSEQSNSKVSFTHFDEHIIQKEGKIIVDLKDLNSTDIKSRISFLESYGAIEINKVALFDLKKAKEFFSNQNLDFVVQKSDFQVICKSYENVLKKLIDLEILKERLDGSYALNYEKFKDLSNSYILGEYFVFHSNIYDFIQEKFAYKIALEFLIEDIENNINPTIRLDINPSMNLVNDLMENLIIEQANVDESKIKNVINIFPQSEIPKLFTRREIKLDTDMINELVRQVNRNNNLEEFNQKFDEKYKNEKSTFDVILRNRHTIINNIEHIKSHLKLFLQPLMNKDLDRIDVFLQRFDNYSLSNESLMLMELKGLGATLQFQKKYYSFAYWMRFASVLGISIFQIISGVTLTYLFSGFSGGVGNNLVNQGISDAVFGLSSLRSGYFCWRDYKTYKFTSITMSLVSIASKFIFSKFMWSEKIKNSSKLNQQTTEIGSVIGGHMKNLTGFQLIESYGWVATKKIFKQSVFQTIINCKNVVIDVGISNAFELIIEKCLNPITETISNSIVTCIMKDFNTHDIKKTIQQMMSFFTADEIKNLIKEKFQLICTKFENLRCLLSKIINEIDSIIQSNDTVKDWISKISAIVKKSSDISMITIFVRTMFDNLNAELNNVLKIKENDKKEISNTGVETDDLERFQDEFLEEFKQVAAIQYTNAINSNILKPTLEFAGKKFTKMLENKISEGISFHKENKLINRSTLILNMIQSLENSSNGIKHTDIPEELVNDIMDIRQRTKNIELYSFLMRQNIPMDEIGIECVRRVLEQKLETKVKFEILHNGMNHELGYRNDESTIVVSLEINNGHFKNEFRGHAKNDCLFYALKEQFPNILDCITPSDFRNEAADIINKDFEIRNTITNSDKGFYIAFGFYGGGRKCIPRTGNQYGSYRDLNREFKNRKILEYEIDHTPPQDCYKGTIYERHNLSYGDKPAILLPIKVHRESLTTGSSKEAIEFRAIQKSYMKKKKIEKAVEMQFKNVHEITLKNYYNKTNFKQIITQIHESQKNYSQWILKKNLITLKQQKYLLKVVDDLAKSVNNQNQLAERSHHQDASSSMQATTSSR